MYDLANSRTDLLSSTLLKMRLRALVSGATDAAGKWAVQIPPFEGFLLYLIVRGEGWIVLDRGKSRHHVRPGDCLLVTSGDSIIATSDPAIKKTIPFDELMRMRKDGLLTINGGGESLAIAIHFQFEGHLPDVVFKGLPPAIHIPEHFEEAAALRANIERFRAEYLGHNVGHLLVLNHLAPIILVQIFRMYLASQQGGHNWLTSLSDPKLAKALDAMHADPAQAWPLDALAAVAGMSRAGFALNFKKKIGVTPHDYLTHWRMQAACDMLTDGAHSVSAIARDVGYQSESAFSTTFVRLMGCRPGSYRAAQRGQRQSDEI